MSKSRGRKKFIFSYKERSHEWSDPRVDDLMGGGGRYHPTKNIEYSGLMKVGTPRENSLERKGEIWWESALNRRESMGREGCPREKGGSM